MSEPWRAEESWLAELREALDEARQVPPNVIAAGHAAFTWRTIDMELAQLTYDSRMEDLSLSGTRAQEAVLRALTLASASLTIELEIEPSALLGQLIPADDSASLAVGLTDGTSFAVEVDQLGCFTIAPIPQDAFRLRVTGRKSVTTDWITV